MRHESHIAKGWWYARFRIKWPENTEPYWHIDLLIAQEIIAPVINQHGKDIFIWRFHRRAARDTEGHQFSLTFYSSPETAKQVFKILRSDLLLKRLKRSGVIIQDIYDNPEKIIAPDIRDTSDGHWSAPVRRAWPFFIMGVCQMWLSLIVEISEGIPEKQKGSSLKKMLSFYQQVNEILKNLWRDEGCHSMLHHLNAIFGYEPIFVREINLRRF
jgi:hypothetical protein